MDEVKRYTATEVRFSTQGGSFVLEADFVAREAALREEVSKLDDQLSDCGDFQQAQIAVIHQLHDDKAAAEQRNTERDTEIAAQVESALRRSFTLGQIYWQQADSDSTCQQNKCDQTMEVQAQHILNVLKSVSVALNPAESGESE